MNILHGCRSSKERAHGAGRGADDHAVRDGVLEQLNAFTQLASSSDIPGLALVETAGGPASPGPSGRLQARAR